MPTTFTRLKVDDNKLPLLDDQGQQQYEEIELDMFDILPPQDGGMNQYYGRIGEGKTYAATADAIADLEAGNVVYTSWKMLWDGYDEREYWYYRLAYKLRLKKFFWKFPKENWHYFDMAADDALEKLGSLTDCIIYLDEGHLLLDSYLATKMERKDRATILHTRHFDRSINIISQRPTAIHVMMRANVNRFYKYECLFKTPFILFRRTEFQDMVDETVDEEKPLSTKLYIGKKSIFNMYNSKYLRGNTPPSQTVHFEAYDLSYWQKLKTLFLLLARKG